ncbi:MAG: maltotransferase domain-containing protein, partial [Dehalococcoidia bacterium]
MKGWAEPRAERIVIEDVRPNVNAGRYPVKRIVGEALDVRASIIKEGHDVLQAEVELWQGEQSILSLPLAHDVATDDWHAGLLLDVPPGTYAYRIVTWTDTYGSWLEEFRRKVGARADVESEALQGVSLIRAAAASADGKRAL